MPINRPFKSSPKPSGFSTISSLPRPPFVYPPIKPGDYVTVRFHGPRVLGRVLHRVSGGSWRVIIKEDTPNPLTFTCLRSALYLLPPSAKSPKEGEGCPSTEDSTNT
jgi:hypothetical protein